MWKITKEQVDKLIICKRINEVILIPENSKKIVSIDALDTSFSIIYINNNFNYSGKELILNNLNEFSKSIKLLNNNVEIEVEDAKVSIIDNEGEIICKYNQGFSNMAEGARIIYEKTDDIVKLIKENENSFTFNFSEKDFINIYKFVSPTYNTLILKEGKIILFDNSGTNEVSSKNTVEINKKEITSNIRIDIDINSFSKVKQGNYNCTYNENFVLFEEIDGDDIFTIAAFANN